MSRLESVGLGSVPNWMIQMKSNRAAFPCSPLFRSLEITLWKISGMVQTNRAASFYPLTLVSCVSQRSSDARPLAVQLLRVLQKHEEEPVAAVTGQHLYWQLPDGGRGHLQLAGERWSTEILCRWTEDFSVLVFLCVILGEIHLFSSIFFFFNLC